MLYGEKVKLRARLDTDVSVLHSELYDDVATRSGPTPVRGGHSVRVLPHRTPPRTAGMRQCSSIVEIASDELAGETLLWGIDLHNRLAHIGISLVPAFGAVA